MFYLFGIITSIMSATTMQLLTLYYVDATQDFFKPFENHVQIVESGSNYFQFFPTSSHLDQNLEAELEQELKTDVIPALFISKSEDFLKFDLSCLIGMRNPDIAILWEGISLSSGRWPESPDEMIVGFDKSHKDQYTVYNHTFTVVGALEQKFSYLDSVFILPLETLQTITGKLNQVNVFYVAKEIESQPGVEQQFEAKFPTLDFLTIEEMSGITANAGNLADNMAKVVIFCTGLSALVFIFALNLLSIHNRKTDFDLFYIMGVRRPTLISLLMLENILLLAIGTIIAIPMSIFTYCSLFTYISTSVKSNTKFLRYFSIAFDNLFQNFPYHDFFGIIGIIVAICLVLTGIVMVIGFRKYNLGKLKEKF